MKYLDFAKAHTSGRPERLVVAIDASPSMEDTDWPPSRLEAAKEAATALIEQKLRIAPVDEVGIVSYGDRATTHCKPVPVGSGKAALFRAIGEIQTRMWTNITAALKESGKSLGSRPIGNMIERWLCGRSESVSNDRIILLSDGFHNHGDDPEPVATKLKQAGVCIDCIGIGGAPDCVDEERLKKIASLQADGVTPRYAFIGDKSALITKFEQLAGRITR